MWAQTPTGLVKTNCNAAYSVFRCEDIHLIA